MKVQTHEQSEPQKFLNISTSKFHLEADATAGTCDHHKLPIQSLLPPVHTHRQHHHHHHQLPVHPHRQFLPQPEQGKEEGQPAEQRREDGKYELKHDTTEFKCRLKFLVLDYFQMGHSCQAGYAAESMETESWCQTPDKSFQYYNMWKGNTPANYKHFVGIFMCIHFTGPLRGLWGLDT